MRTLVAAVIIRHYRVLIIQRSSGELHGKWEFPGGDIEGKETAVEAIQRIGQKDLGVKIVPERTIQSFLFEDPTGTIHLTVVWCTMSFESIALLSERSRRAYKWAYILHGARVNFIPLHKRVMEFLLKDKS